MTSSSLEFCVRNTEEAEKATQAGANRRGQAKGVWGMIEQSELAESIREDDKRKVEEQIDIPSLLSCRDPTDFPSSGTDRGRPRAPRSHAQGRARGHTSPHTIVFFVIRAPVTY